MILSVNVKFVTDFIVKILLIQISGNCLNFKSKTFLKVLDLNLCYLKFKPKSVVLWPLEASPAALRGWAFDRFGVRLGFALTVTWIGVFLLAPFIVTHFVKKW
jgi:hypothetical protein